MKYWITTQWPNRKTSHVDKPHNGIWVADDKRDVIAPMSKGDIVWIYESLTGRSIVKEKANEEKQIIKHHRGRGGIVTLVEVTEEAEEDLDSETETYTDGSKLWWRWHAETKIVNSAGFVPRLMLNNILGFKDNYSLRGFGTRKSGLKEISTEEHEEILNFYLNHHTDKDSTKLSRKPLTRKGGEGPIHKALKLAIAANPSEMLGETNLSLVKIEYAFEDTGDRIDVLLKDRYGRYVAVEVEPECPSTHQAGPLQCMKYRALLSYRLDREVEEVRMFLVAHDISEEVKSKASKYGIECFKVPVSKVQPLSKAI
ncbi:MAG: hypothetical protein WD509_02705 [Candidatus Paceibacterota bacterium]